MGQRWESFWVEGVLVAVGLPLLPLVPVILHKRDDLAKALLAVVPVYVLGLGSACKHRGIKGTVIAFGFIAAAAFGFDPGATVQPGDQRIAAALVILGVVLFLLDQFRYRVVRGEG